MPAPAMAGGRAAIFLDKDGTILEDVPYNVDPARMRFAPRADAALRRLGALGLPLIVVSNQSGVARGDFAAEALAAVERRLAALFAEVGARLAGFYFCPHHPDAAVVAYRCSCLCRKPMPGLLRRAAVDLRIDLGRSWMVGDILDDIEAGRRAGCRTILVDNGNETEWLIDRDAPALRTPDHLAADLEVAARIIDGSLVADASDVARRLRAQVRRPVDGDAPRSA